MKREIDIAVKGFHTVDGGGVHVIRVLGNETVDVFDPFLMLDSFDTTHPEDYEAGFPMHPHRGIETFTFVSEGNINHKDSMGFSDTVSSGEVQYMSAGSGILPSKEKMSRPSYKAIKNGEIPEVKVPGGKVRVLVGSYEGTKGYESHHLPLDYYDIHLEPGASLTFPVDPKRSAMGFTLQGDVTIEGKEISEKTAVHFTEGDEVTITAGKEPVEFMFMSSFRLDEPVYWGGPVVMDTRSGLWEAFRELDHGNFLKEEMEIEE